MYVGMYVCMYVCMSLCLYVLMYEFMYVYVKIRSHFGSSVRVGSRRSSFCADPAVRPSSMPTTPRSPPAPALQPGGASSADGVAKDPPVPAPRVIYKRFPQKRGPLHLRFAPEDGCNGADGAGGAGGAGGGSSADGVAKDPVPKVVASAPPTQTPTSAPGPAPPPPPPGPPPPLAYAPACCLVGLPIPTPTGARHLVKSIGWPTPGPFQHHGRLPLPPPPGPPPPPLADTRPFPTPTPAPGRLPRAHGVAIAPPTPTPAKPWASQPYREGLSPGVLYNPKHYPKPPPPLFVFAGEDGDKGAGGGSSADGSNGADGASAAGGAGAGSSAAGVVSPPPTQTSAPSALRAPSPPPPPPPSGPDYGGGVSSGPEYERLCLRVLRAQLFEPGTPGGGRVAVLLERYIRWSEAAPVEADVPVYDEEEAALVEADLYDEEGDRRDVHVDDEDMRFLQEEYWPAHGSYESVD
jgi:hypothetical protein